MIKEDQFQKMVHDFHVGIGGQGPDVELRVSLIQEEANEFIDAVGDKDIIEAIDALCDLLYVVYGSADVFEQMLDTEEASNTIPPPSGHIDWIRLSSELHDFTSCVGAAVGIIRTNCGSSAVKIHLDELANGCWKAGAIALGVDLRPFFREVHRTNMHKLAGPKREDGKQLKPPGWKPPRIMAMYNRLQVNKPSICEGKEPCDNSWVEHFEGGQQCARCGGLNVEAPDEQTHLEMENREDGAPRLLSRSSVESPAEVPQGMRRHRMGGERERRDV